MSFQLEWDEESFESHGLEHGNLCRFGDDLRGLEYTIGEDVGTKKFFLDQSSDAEWMMKSGIEQVWRELQEIAKIHHPKLG